MKTKQICLVFSPVGGTCIPYGYAYGRLVTLLAIILLLVVVR